MADIIDVTNPRDPTPVTPPDCWLLGKTNPSKKRKYRVECFENWNGSTAVKVENITESTLMCVVIEGMELVEVKSFHHVGPLGGLTDNQ